MYIVRDQTGQTSLVETLEEAARIVELDLHEIAWALEEFGVCETDTHCVEVEEVIACREDAA